ncbi:MAG: hypothetical protein PWR10_2125 [Halanaerobiales bacterium]|nr:hypothetical protein [Halanaerobiales bacterium]
MLEKMLAEKGLTLIVSLPENSPEMAKAALDGGADALKVHANVSHKASGNKFPSVKEQKDIFAEIIDLAGEIPVGLVPGDAPEKITAEELTLVQQLGFDFLSIYAHHIPVKELQDSPFVKAVAYDQSYQIKDAVNYDQLGIDIIEASIVPKDEYGQRLTYKDIINYSALKNIVQKPVIIPTQKAIQPEELNLLSKTGVDAIMIGAVVTGNSIEGVKRVTRLFKDEINKGGY